MKPRIAIPEPCSLDKAYSERSLKSYVHAVERSGGEAVVIPLKISPEETAKRITGCSAVLLPGSDADIDPQKYGAEKSPKTTQVDSPREDADELLLQDAYNLHKPILGICYGLQALNVWRTGTLVQHIESPVNHTPAKKPARAHEVTVAADSLLAREIQCTAKNCTVAVNSSHHQAAEVVGDGLKAVARCPEDGVIEAIEGTQPGHYVLAVQWHPERDFATDQASRRLFESFVREAARWKPRK